MSENRTSIQKQLEYIIEEKKIYPVYQPIVSLKTGQILGYEALSRISYEACTFNVEEMFTYAEEFQCLWNLEYLCRKKALKGIKNDPGNRKLFLNVDPNVFNDERFKAGMTLSYLERYNISPDNIVFEVCERTNIQEIAPFQKAVSHYEKQNYQLAIDDFGKGFAGVNRIFFLHPKYVKIDISLVSNIDKDSVKCSLVEGFIKFCHSENICLIADCVGIESAHTDGKAFHGKSISDRDYFVQPWETGSTVVCEPEFSKTTGGRVLAIGTPIYDNNVKIGVLVGFVRLEYVSSLLNQNKVTENSYEFMLNSDGTLSAHPDDSIVLMQNWGKPSEDDNASLDALAKMTTTQKNAIAAMMRGESGIITGENYVYAYTPIPGSKMSLFSPIVLPFHSNGLRSSFIILPKETLQSQNVRWDMKTQKKSAR